jgi:hypothetical protein
MRYHARASATVNTTLAPPFESSLVEGNEEGASCNVRRMERIPRDLWATRRRRTHDRRFELASNGGIGDLNCLERRSDRSFVFFVHGPWDALIAVLLLTMLSALLHPNRPPTPTRSNSGRQRAALAQDEKQSRVVGAGRSQVVSGLTMPHAHARVHCVRVPRADAWHGAWHSRVCIFL